MGRHSGGGGGRPLCQDRVYLPLRLPEVTDTRWPDRVKSKLEHRGEQREEERVFRMGSGGGGQGGLCSFFFFGQQRVRYLTVARRQPGWGRGRVVKRGLSSAVMTRDNSLLSQVIHFPLLAPSQSSILDHTCVCRHG